MSSNSLSVDVSVVIIGRNEGTRLERCLQSVQQANWADVSHQLIYIDSRSSDNSVATARSLGAEVIVLDDASPCASKARNLGWREAVGQYVLFLDGDTELHAEFVTRALKTLADPKLCAVWGHRRESRPSQSIYTKVLDLDWIYPVGRTLYFGGDVLVRRSALAQVDGFDPTLKAGEEPEMCARLRAVGWEIEHIDAPMTLHDLAVNSFRAYWLRAYRSGIAYAEVAERMRIRGDVLWQHEARRDFYHGIVFLASPIFFIAALWFSSALALILLSLAILFLLRTAQRCAWKAPGQRVLCAEYAVHAHFQKIPALFGQFRWRQARRQRSEIALVDYKDESAGNAVNVKALLARMLTPLAWCRRVLVERWLRLWHLARLQEAVGRSVDSSNVIMGGIELHGTRNIHLGRNALIYPGVYLETQGAGIITIGNNVVLSRGVHVVAFNCVKLGDDCMVGEYASLRDANHELDDISIRNAGHVSAAIRLGRNVWIGRGVTILKGVSIGDNSVVGANAVVTKSFAAHQVVGGVPAKTLRQSS